MKVLVTGGAGFIGSHISELLLARGDQVAVVDNLRTGKLANLPSGVTFYHEDITQPLLASIFRREKPQVVIHQAAQVSVPKSVADPKVDTKINIAGTINVLEAAKKCGVRKIVFASSAAVYGEPQYLPLDEEHPVSVQSPYGLAKHTVERYLALYRSLYGLEYTVLRYANVYGPRQDGQGEGGVVAIFAHCLSRGLVPTIFGSGEQTRDFVFVKDVAAANIAATTHADGQVLNISTNHAISVNQLYEKMARIWGVDTPANRGPDRAGDIEHSTLNNTKACRELAWAPKWSLDKGLAALKEGWGQTT
jgi:UDP-glucose 4-epimerase